MAPFLYTSPNATLIALVVQAVVDIVKINTPAATGMECEAVQSRLPRSPTTWQLKRPRYVVISDA